MQGKMPSAATQALGEEEVAGENANDPPEVPKSTLQPLFSLIQSGLEQLDSRALPLCLHQVLH
jgi:consortin